MHIKRLPLADTMGCGRTDGAKDMLQVAGSTNSYVETYTWQLIVLLTRGKRRRFRGRIRTRLIVSRVLSLDVASIISHSLACFALWGRRQVGGNNEDNVPLNRTRIN